jgi:hypothetical protein
MTLAVVATIAISFFSTEGHTGRDFSPLVLGLQAEITGSAAYSTETQQQIGAHFATPGPTQCLRCSQIGLAYPMPALLLALPVAGIDIAIAERVLMLLSVALFAVALRINSLPPIWLLSAPAFQAIRANNPSLLLVALLLIGFWAAGNDRWWLVAICVAFTIGAKPQTTLLLAGALAVVTIRAGQWKPLLVSCGGVGVITLLLDPLWFSNWLAVVRDYREVTTSAAAYPWLWWALPLPALMLWRGHVWPGLALLQVLLSPINVQSPYVTLPLLVGYAAMSGKGRLVAWLPGWFFIPIGETIGFLFATVITLFVPFVEAATYQERLKEQHELA